MTVSLETIHLEYRTISLEAATPSQFFSAVTRRLPAFVQDVKSFVSDVFSMNASDIKLVDARGLNKKISSSNVTFTTMRDMAVSVPVDLAVSYSEYLDVLERGQDVCDVLVKETLEPFSKWINGALADPTMLASLRSPAALKQFKMHPIEQIKKDIGNCFNGKKSGAKPTLSDAAGSVSELNRSIERGNNLVERLARTNRPNIVKVVDEIVKGLDTLIRRTEEKPEQYKLNGNNMKLLAELAYNMGSEVEFYSVYSVQLRSLVMSMADTVQMLEKGIR